MRYLEAIETEDYRRLPGGIFNRSFIRAYAKFVGYDEDQAIEEYSSTMREHGQSDDAPQKHHKSLVYTDDHENEHRSPLRTLLLAIIILALLSLAVWGGLYLYQKKIAGQGALPANFSAKEEPHGNRV